MSELRTNRAPSIRTDTPLQPVPRSTHVTVPRDDLATRPANTSAKPSLEQVPLDEPPSERFTLTRRQMLDQAHQSRAGHLGLRRTYNTLNKLFPGHGISISQVTEYKELCPTCQKTEDYMSSQLVPIVRHLKTTNPGRVVGMDYLSVVEDKFGNVGAYVLRDHFTKFVYISPTHNHDAPSAALAIFSYCVLYGAFDILMTDPGSDFTSEAVEQVNKWFGIHHRLSLVDRHESNGVEGANKQILRHLMKLFMTERVKDKWSSPECIGWVMFLMNKFDSSESGASPYDLTFGTVTNRRFDFAERSMDSGRAHKYVKLLDDSLKTLTSAATRYQADLVQKRTAVNQIQNVYQPGDLVLFRLDRGKHKPHKLHPIYLGPFEVIRQTKNDVEVRHLTTNTSSVFYVADLKVFYGSRADALQLATVDADQYMVTCITAHRGDPMSRSHMSFFVEYADGDKLWVPWSLDLQNTEAYYAYAETSPALVPLTMTSLRLTEWRRMLQGQPVTGVRPGQELLLDLRALSAGWYDTLTLPDKDTHTYLVPVIFGPLSPNKRSICLTCPLLNLSYAVDNVFVRLHVQPRTLDVPHTVVDKTLVDEHPSLRVSPSKSARSPRDYQHLVGHSFYDPDARTTFQVTRIAVTRTHDIVAYVRKYKRDGTLGPENQRPYHVADVIQLVPADSTHPPARTGSNSIPERER